MTLEEFLASDLRNFHIENPWIIGYVRKTMRHIIDRGRKCLDIADVNVHPDKYGKGVFAEWLKMAETIAPTYGIDGLYVENVINERLPAFLIRNGYVAVPHMPMCYFKALETQKP